MKKITFSCLLIGLVLFLSMGFLSAQPVFSMEEACSNTEQAPMVDGGCPDETSAPLEESMTEPDGETNDILPDSELSESDLNPNDPPADDILSLDSPELDSIPSDDSGVNPEVSSTPEPTDTPVPEEQAADSGISDDSVTDPEVIVTPDPTDLHDLPLLDELESNPGQSDDAAVNPEVSSTPEPTDTPVPEEQTADSDPSDDSVTDPEVIVTPDPTDLPDLPLLDELESNPELTDGAAVNPEISPTRSTEELLDSTLTQTPEEELTEVVADSEGKDPGFIWDHIAYWFRTSCEGWNPDHGSCTPSATPFQAAINALKAKIGADGLDAPVNVFVEKATFDEELVISDISNLLDTPNGKERSINFYGGCGTGVDLPQECTNGNATLNGTVTIQNVVPLIRFTNFIFNNKIFLNGADVEIKGGAGTGGSDNTFEIVDQGGKNLFTYIGDSGSSAESKEIVHVTTSRPGGFTFAEINVGKSSEQDIVANFKSVKTDNKAQLIVIANKVKRLDISEVSLQDLVYKFEKLQKVLALAQASDNGGETTITGKMDAKSSDYGVVRFGSPTNSLTINVTAADTDLTVESFYNADFSGDLSILGSSQRNEIKIKTDLLLKGRNLHIKGHLIIVDEGKFFSTRSINTSGTPDYETAVSTGDSGKILIESFKMTLSKVKLLAHAISPANATYKSGNVTILGQDTNGWNVPELNWIREKLASILVGTGLGVYVNCSEIVLTDVMIKGNDVNLRVNSGYSINERQAEDLAGILNSIVTGSGLGFFLDDLFGLAISGEMLDSISQTITDIGILNKGVLPIPIGFNARVAYSELKLDGNTSIEADGDVSLLTNASSDADLIVRSTYFGIALGVSVVRSWIDVLDNTSITSKTGNIILRSEGAGNTSITAGSYGDSTANVLPLAVAIGVSIMDSKTNVSSGTTLTAEKSVSVVANGSNVGGANASVLVFEGGTRAMTFGIYTGVSNVLAKADGTITAKTAVNVRSRTPIDLSKIGSAGNNTIYIENHGLSTGERIIYRKGDNADPIEGLVDGDQYYVYVVDNNNIRLYSRPPANLTLNGVEENQPHTFTPFDLVIFTQNSAIISNEDETFTKFTFNDHSFTENLKVWYSSLMSGPLNGLDESTEYTVELIDSNSFKLKKADGTYVKGVTFAGDTIHSFWFLNEAKKKTIIPVSADSSPSPIDVASSTITVPGHGFETGDMVFYSVPSGEVSRNLNVAFSFTADSDNVTQTTLKIPYGVGLKVNDEVLYIPGDNTTIAGLTSGNSYKIATIVDCNTAEPDGVCKLVTLKDSEGNNIQLGTIVTDPEATGHADYIPLHSLVKQDSYMDGHTAVGHLKEHTAYYIIKIDDDHFMLANSFEAATEYANGIEIVKPTDSTIQGHALELQVINGIGVIASLTLKEEMSSGSYYNQGRALLNTPIDYIVAKGIELTIKGIGKVVDKVKSIFGFATEKAKPEEKADPDPGFVTFSSGLGVLVSVNSVKAEVGSTAKFNSTRDIEVKSYLSHNHTNIVESESVPGREDGEKASVGASLSATVLIDKNQAIIADGAELNADRDILVDAQSIYPSRILNTLQAIKNAGIGDVVGVITGTVSSTTFAFYPDLLNGLVRSVGQGNIGEDITTEMSVAGSIGVMVLDSKTYARIGDNVKINQARQNTTQNVKVSAKTDAAFALMAGNFVFNTTPALRRDKKIECVKKFFKDIPKSVFSPFGASGGKKGIGGSFYLPVVIFKTVAEIGNNTLIHVGKQGSLQVLADTNVNNFTFVQAGSEASDGFAVAGAISYNGIFNTTTAKIAPLARITGGDVAVSANDHTQSIALVGAIAKGTSIGVGASFGVNTIIRNVSAIIGYNNENQGGPWQVMFTNTNSDPITATAVAPFNGKPVIDTVTDGGVDTAEIQLLDTTETDDVTLTYDGVSTTINAAALTPATLETALNGLSTVSDIGGVKVVAGDYGGWKIIFNNPGSRKPITLGTVEATILELGRVNAYEAQTLSMGNPTQGAFRLSFQDELTEVLPWDATDSQVQAALNKLATIKNLKLDASNTPVGAVTVVKDAATGNYEITFNVYKDLDEVAFERLDTSDGSIYVKANGTNQNQTIYSSMMGGAFYLTYKGVNTKLLPYDASFSDILVALQELQTIVDAGGVTVTGAQLSDGSGIINASGEIDVSAKATGSNWVFSLAAAGTTNASEKGGIGMPKAGMLERLLTHLGLAGKKMDKAGSDAFNGGVGDNAGKQVENSVSGAGDLSVNVLIDKVIAAIRNAGLVTASKINVTAVNDTELRSVSGTAAITLAGENTSAGIAGSVSFNWVDGFTKAIVDDVKIAPSTLNDVKPNELTIEASRTGDIVSISAGGAGAPRQKGLAIAGSVSVNILRGSTDAVLSNIKSSSEISGPVKVVAKDNSDIVVVAGAGSYGGKVGFGAALSVNLIQSETNALFKASDLTYDGALEVNGTNENLIVSVAGAGGVSKDQLGVGGTVAVNILLSSVKAIVSEVTASSTAANGNALINALNNSSIINIAGAIGVAKNTGVGAAVAFNMIQPTIVASIRNSNLAVGDFSDPDNGDQSKIDVKAKDTSLITAIAAGGAGSEELSVAAGVSANVILSDVKASIEGTSSHHIKATGDISVLASAENNIYGGSGNGAGAGKFAVGASLTFNLSQITAAAFVKGATVESYNGDIYIRSIANSDMVSVSAGGQYSGNIAVGGSVVIGILSNDISAYISDGADVTAAGSVLVSAEDDFTGILLAGGGNAAGSTSFGASNSTFISSNIVQSYVGANVKVRGKGKKAVVKTLGADLMTPGDWKYVDNRGVFVTAVSNHAVRIFAIVGSGAGTTAITGSGTLSILNDTVKAYIGSGATVEAANDDTEDDLSSTTGDPNNSNPLTVRVFAAGKTTMWGVAGAFSGAGTSAIGVGLDVGVLTKTVEAYVDGTVNSEGDIIVQALSKEQIISVSASGAGSGSMAVEGSVGVYTLVLKTKAYVGSSAVLSAAGSILVNAYHETLAVLTVGSAGGSSSVAAGASLEVAVEVKDVHAYISNGATVNARGLGNGLTAFSGSFTETYTDVPVDQNGDIIREDATVTVTRPSFDPTTVTDNTITLDVDPGWKTGDLVSYNIGDATDNAIGGLEDGISYYVIVDPSDSKKIKLATDYLNARDGIAITLDPSAATGNAHTLWRGEIAEKPYVFNLPGVLYDEDLNDDGTKDNDPNIDVLTKEREAAPESISFNGLAVSAINKETLLTISVSAGGSGSMAVEVGALTNVVVIDVDAHIGENAKINQKADLNLDSRSSVYVLAGHDFFHVGVVASIAVSGEAAAAPSFDATVYVVDVKSKIADGAKVKAAKDVIVNANAESLFVSVAAGGSGAGMVGAGGSVGIVTMVTNTVASIGDDDGDTIGATVTTNGNVFVNAYDKANVVLVTGAIGIGVGGGGFGASVGVLVDVRKTYAIIAPYSQVTANGLGASINDKVYTKDMGSDGSFSTFPQAKGVIVQAYASDVVTTVVFAGAGGLYGGLAGAVLVDVFQSDAVAKIGEHATVTSGGDVFVNALNYTKIFNFAGTLSGGIGAVSGSVAVNVVRNNAKAIIGQAAMITAIDQVQVAALSNKDTTTVSASLSGGGVGIGVSVLVNVIGSEFSTQFETEYSETERDENGELKTGTTHTHKETISADVLGDEDESGDQKVIGVVDETDDNYGQISTSLDDLYTEAPTNEDETNTADFGKLVSLKLKDVSTRVAEQDISSKAKAALEATGTTARSGTIAVIETGATVKLSGEASVLNVIAQERVNDLAIGGSVAAGGLGVGGVVAITVIGSNANAIIESGASVQAYEINVIAGLDSNIDATSVAGSISFAGGFTGQVVVLDDHANQVASIGSVDTVTTAVKAETINVKAKANRVVKANASGLTAGQIAAGFSVAVSNVDGQTLASLKAVTNQPFTMVDDFSKIKVNVNAEGSVETHTLTINLAGGSVGGAAGVVTNTVKPTVEAYITESVIKSNELQVISKLQSKIISKAVAVAVTAAGGGGLNIAIVTNAPIIRAYIKNSELYKQAGIVIKTLYNADDVGNQIEGKDVFVSSTAINGAALAGLTGSIAVIHSAPEVSTRLFGSEVQESSGFLEILSKVYNKFEVESVGGAVSGAASAVVNLAVVDNSNSKYLATINTTKFVNGYGIVIDNHVIETASSKVVGASLAALGSGFINVAVSTLTPVVESGIHNLIGSSFIELNPEHPDLNRKVNIFAQYDGDAQAKALGVAVSSGISLGASVAVTFVDPVIEAYLTSDSDVSILKIESDIPWIIEARQNINKDGSFVESGAISQASASGGGIFSGTGSIATAKNRPTVNAKAAVKGHLVIRNLIINALTYSLSSAETFGVSVGGVGMGASVSTADSDGTVKATFATGTTGKNVETLYVKATVNDNAYATSVSGVGGVISANGSVANATAQTDSTAEITGSSTLTSQQIDVESVARPMSLAEANGVSAGGLAVGASVATSTVKPTVKASVNANITSTILNVKAQKLTLDSILNSNAEANAAAGALIGINATVAKTYDETKVSATIGSGRTIESSQISVYALNNSKQQAITSNLVISAGGLITIAVGGSEARSTTDLETVAEVGNNTKIKQSSVSTNSFSVEASTTIDQYAQTSALAGSANVSVGSVAVAGSVSATDSNSDTRAIIGSGTIIDVNRFSLKANHQVIGKSSLNSIVGGVIGGSGAAGYNTANSTVIAEVGANSKITAEQAIELEAKNQTDLEDEKKGTTGGLVSVAGVYSDTKITLVTKINILSNAVLTTKSTDKNLIQVFAAATNIVNAKSTMTFTTGGALSGAGATNKISARDVLAEITVGADAKITSNGGMALSARTSGTLEGNADIETFGAGTVMLGSTKAEIFPINRIIVEGGAELAADNELTIAAGRSTDTSVLDSSDVYKVHARWDGFAGSLIPIEKVNAEAYIIQTNKIDIKAGSRVRAGSQLSLFTDSWNTVDLVAKAKVVSWVSLATDGITKLFSDNSVEFYAGTKLAENHASVIMNGYAESGFNRVQEITFEKLIITVYDEGNAKKNSCEVITKNVVGGISYALKLGTINQSLVDSLNAAYENLYKYGATSDLLKSFYEGEIERLKEELAKTTTPIIIDKPDPEPDVYLYPAKSVIVIRVDPIIAAAGRIDIRTGILNGSGEFNAPANPKVTITNNTPAFLEIMGITIPTETGGVYLNTSRINSNSEITTSNTRTADRLNSTNKNGVDWPASPGTAAFLLSGEAPGTEDPVIKIQNTLDINNFTLDLRKGEGAEISDETMEKIRNAIQMNWPDITVLPSSSGGSGIYNDNGKVIIKTFDGGHSSIRILNIIRAKNQQILSGGGDVYISGLTSYSIGGEASNILNYYTKNADNVYVRNGMGTITDEDYNSTLNENNVGTLVGDRITIEAEYINLNGIIQSGKDLYKLTLDSQTLAEIALYKGWHGTFLLSETTRRNPGFNVWYHTEEKLIRTDPIKSSGGFVSLTGHIVNTGYGEIRVLGGYPRVEIDNQTPFNLKLDGIDLSHKGEGILLINDLAGGTPDITGKAPHTDGNSYISSFSKADNGIVVQTQDVRENNSPVSTTIVNSPTITYKPDASWRYGWATVQYTTTVQYATVQRGAWLGIIPDVFQEIDDEYWGPKIVSAAEYGGNGPYFYKDDTSGLPEHNETFKRVEISNTGQVEISRRSWWTWYGSKVVELKFEKRIGYMDTYDHQVNAHQDVLINYIGYDTGNIRIQSTENGNIILNGKLINPSGDVNITAVGGAISSNDGNGTIQGVNINLISGNEIGTDIVPLSIQLMGDSGNLFARSAAGNINLKSFHGDLRIIHVNAPLGNVTLKSAGSMTKGSDPEGKITGKNITLISGGTIGTSSSDPISIDSSTNGQFGKVNISALDNIYLVERTGNLNLEKMTTEKDVWLKIIDGSLIDANKIQTRDDRTYEELLNSVYKRLQLLEETGAQDKIDNLYSSIVTIKTQEYRTYWQYRNQQDDPTNYDATFIVKLTDAEKTYYEDFYRQLGTEQGISEPDLDNFVADSLQTLEEARTEQYHSLHALYSSVGDSYNPDYVYVLSQAEKDTIKSGVKVWTKDELQQLISANLLKEVSSTLSNNEDPNIVARNIALDINGSVGIYNDVPMVIPVDADGHLAPMTDDQKVALAAAERSDVAYVGDTYENTISIYQNRLTLPTGTYWDTTIFKPGLGILIENWGMELVYNLGDNRNVWTVTDVNENVLTVDRTVFSSELGEFFGPMETTVKPVITTDLRDYTGKISELLIFSRDDINVDVHGTINALVKDNLFLGGGLNKNSDLNIGSVESTNGGEIQIKSHRSVINVATSSQNEANVITSGDVVLEAGDGSVGTTTKPIYTAITGGKLTARAFEDVFITQCELVNGSCIRNTAHPYLMAGNAPDLHLSSIYSQTGSILFQTAGSILDGENTDFVKVLGRFVNLIAGNAIGESDDALEVKSGFSKTEPANGWLKATALNNINIADREGDLGVLNILSYQGDVTLLAQGSILDSGDLIDPYDPASAADPSSVGGTWPKANVIGKSISLNAVLGAVGEASNEFDIDSQYSGTGTLSVSSGNLLNNYLIETTGDVLLNTVTAGADVISFITAPSGSILNGANDGDFNITSGKAKLSASQNIGTAVKNLTTKVGRLEGTAINGGIWIYNTGALVTGLVTDTPDAIVSGGDVVIKTAGSNTIAANVTAVDNITLSAIDSSGAGDDIIVNPNIEIISPLGSIFLEAGDDLNLKDGVQLQALHDIYLRGDYNPGGDSSDPDTLGSVVEIRGTLTPGVGKNVNVHTFGDNDKVHIYTSFDGIIKTGDGDDEILFYGDIKLTNGGTVDGGAGNDTLNYANYQNPVGIYISGIGSIDGVKGTEGHSLSGGFDNIDGFTGTSLSDEDVFIGTDDDSTWFIKKDGSIDYTILSRTINLRNFKKLISGSGNDRFILEDGATFPGDIIANAGTDTLDFGNLTTVIDVELSDVGSVDGFQGNEQSLIGFFDNVEMLIGTNPIYGNDILRGLDQPSEWLLNNGTDGTYTSIGRTLVFNNVDSLISGTHADTFTIADGAISDAHIDGGSGNDTLYSGNPTVPITIQLLGIGSIDGFTGEQTNLTGSFTNINHLVGSNNTPHTLAGLNQPSIWTLAPSQPDTYTSLGRSITFSEVVSLVGGTSTDQFVFSGDRTFTGDIDGGSGLDTLDYAAYDSGIQTYLTASGGIDGFNGTVTGITGSFTNINEIVNTPYEDTLTGADQNAVWTLSSNGAGNYTSGTNQLIFSELETKVGGAADDDFVIQDGVTNAETLDGGLGSNKLNYLNRTTPAEFLLNGFGSKVGFSGAETTANAVFDNMTAVTGSAIGLDSLTGIDSDAVWNIFDGDQVLYQVGSNTLDIASVENLNGAAMSDIFKFGDGVTTNISLNGGAGANWLDYSNYTSPVSVNLTTGEATGLLPKAFRNIANVIGGISDDLLIGDSGNNQLHGGAGNDFLYGEDGNDILYGGAGIDYLYGGKGDDRFLYIGNEEFNDFVHGDSGLNTLDFSASSNPVNVLLEAIGLKTGFNGSLAGQSGSFNEINNLIGTALADTLTGLNESTIWVIGVTGNKLTSLNRNLYFNGIENLVGGNKWDAFSFNDGAIFDGNIDGGPGYLGNLPDNLIDFSRYTTPVVVDLMNNYASPVTGAITNFLRITGGKANDLLIGNDLPNVIDGGPGNDEIHGMGGNDVLYTGTGNNIVYGGSGNDYIFSGIGFNILYGGDGFDTADIEWTGQYWIPLDDIELIILHNPEETLKQRWNIKVIDVVNGQYAGVADVEYDGFLVRLPSLDQVFVFRDTAEQVILSDEDDAGAALPVNMASVKVMSVRMQRRGIEIKGGMSLFLVSFVLPADSDPSQYAILFWDENSKTWIEIPAAFVIDSANGGIGRLQAWVSRTGKYVLVKKGL